MPENEKKNWVVKLYGVCNSSDSGYEERGYYSKDVAWRVVEKEQATKMTRKDARNIASRLRQPRIGYKTDIEEIQNVGS